MRCLRVLLALAVVGLASAADAAPVTFSAASGPNQGAPYIQSNSIDGVLTGAGWANNGNPGDAYFTISGAGLTLGSLGSNLTFTLRNSDAGNADHVLGHYRLYSTTSGVVGPGSTWNVLTPLTAVRTGGGTITINPGVGPTNSILISDTNVATDIHTITASIGAGANITGIRLEAIDLAGNLLPGNGPGAAGNGNWVLSEFQLDAVNIDPPPLAPEPGSIALLGIALSGMAGITWWKRRRAG